MNSNSINPASAPSAGLPGATPENVLKAAPEDSVSRLNALLQQPARENAPTMPGQPQQPGQVSSPSGGPAQQSGQGTVSGMPAQQQGQTIPSGVSAQQPGQTIPPDTPAQQSGQTSPPSVSTQQSGQANSPGLPAQQPGQANPSGVSTQQFGQANPLGMSAQQPGQTNPLGMAAQQPGQTNPPAMPVQQQGQMNSPGLPPLQPGQANPSGMPAQQTGQVVPPGAPAQQPVQGNVLGVSPEQGSGVGMSAPLSGREVVAAETQGRAASAFGEMSAAPAPARKTNAGESPTIGMSELIGQALTGITGARQDATPVQAAAPTAPTTAANAAQCDELVERILVSQPSLDGSGEVRIKMDRSWLPDTEVRIMRAPDGGVSVEFESDSVEAQRFLLPNLGGLKERLAERTGEPVTVRMSEGDKDSSQPEDGRSRNRRNIYEEREDA